LSLSLIAAMDINGLIGAKGTMPWHIPEELAWFKGQTMGSIVVMGRKTWQSLGKPLPGRRNIVLSSNLHFPAEGAEVMNSDKQILSLAKDFQVFIIGGAELFRLFMPAADKLYLSTIHAEYSGDTYFPDFNAEHFSEIHHESITTEQNIKIDFRILNRRK